MGLLSGLFGGGSKTTSTSTSEPWEGSQKALKQAISGAQDLYKKGVGGKVYTGSTVVPWSVQTRSAMDTMSNTARANMNGRGLSGQYQDIIDQGGYSDAMRIAQAGYDDVINRGGYNDAMRSSLAGYQDIERNGGYNDAMRTAQNAYQSVMNQKGYNDAMRDALGGYNALQSDPFNAYQKSALKNTQALADSKYGISPELQRVLDAQGSRAREAVNLNASSLGRYGSGSHDGVVAREVGDLANQTIYNDYTNFLGRRDAANSNLFSMGQTGIGTQMGANAAIAGLGQTAMGNAMNAGAGIAGIGQTALGNRMGANSGIAGLGQTAAGNSLAANNAKAGMAQNAIGNLGTSYTGLNAPATDMMSIGSMNEDLKKRQIDDKLRIFNEKENKPWELLGKLNGIAGGAGQMGGTTTQSQPGQNPFLSALGYGATGAGLFGSFF